MCGIAGIVGEVDAQALQRMAESLRHRGPDDQGVWKDEGVGLAHARLAIIDTSPLGHQPMFDARNRNAIVFNGEIYNFSELKKELSSYPFKTHTDTEVILAAYKTWGMSAFEKLEGMFAVAIWDSKESQLILVRDRMGEKPLYYTYQQGLFVFASELGALMSSGCVRKELNKDALLQYLQFDYVPTPNCIMRDVHKLEPATVLMFQNGKVSKRKFWAPPKNILEVSEREALKKLDAAFDSSIARELVSDVPLGVFLSGGIDSSAVAYYAQKNSSRPIETFSIGFDDPSFDESAYASEVSKYLGTNHHERRISSREALDLVPTIPEVFSEPVADASVIPTMLLSHFARGAVTVALGGDGGDELFAGYPTFKADDAYKWFALMPTRLKRTARSVVEALPVSHANFAATYAMRKLVSSDESDPVHRHLTWLGTFDSVVRSRLMGTKLSESPDNVFVSIEAMLSDFTQDDTNNRLLFAYARSYLMDQVLVKVDRACMHYALETRAPFLDRPVVDLVFSLPYDMKYRRGRTKYLLKRLMDDKLPKHIVHRKKKGFGIPLAAWLNGPLRDLCDDLLSERSLRMHDLFDAQFVHRLVLEHRTHVRDNRKELWNLMVFQLWYKRWML